MDGASGGKQDVWEHREKIFWECGTGGNWGYLGYQRKSILEMRSQWGKLGISGKIGENILEIWMEPVEGNWGCPHWLYIPRMFSPVFALHFQNALSLLPWIFAISTHSTDNSRSAVCE